MLYSLVQPKIFAADNSIDRNTEEEKKWQIIKKTEFNDFVDPREKWIVPTQIQINTVNRIKLNYLLTSITGQFVKLNNKYE